MRHLLLLALGLLAAPTPPPVSLLSVSPVAAAEATNNGASRTDRDLQRFMQHELNPAFTELSYQLFHAQAEAEEEAVLAAAERLQQLTERLPGYAQTVGGDLTSFHVHTVQLRIAARALAAADSSELKFWFNQLSAVCSSCHDDYKP